MLSVASRYLPLSSNKEETPWRKQLFSNSLRNNWKSAKKFYETIFSLKLNLVQFGPELIAVFPYEPPAISGCLIEADGLKPGHGALPCLNADPHLDAVLEKVERAGGRIVHPYSELPPGMGCFARIEDTEGNLVGLHAMQ